MDGKVLVIRKKNRRQHPWVFSNEIKKIEGKPKKGDSVLVYEHDNFKLLYYILNFGVALLVFLLGFFIYLIAKSVSGQRPIGGYIGYILCFMIVSSFANRWQSGGTIVDEILKWALILGRFGVLISFFAIVILLFGRSWGGRDDNNPYTDTGGGGGRGPSPWQRFKTWRGNRPTPEPRGPGPWKRFRDKRRDRRNPGGNTEAEIEGVERAAEREARGNGRVRQLLNRIRGRDQAHHADEAGEVAAERQAEVVENDLTQALGQGERIAGQLAMPELDSLERELAVLIQEETKASQTKRLIDQHIAQLTSMINSGQIRPNDPQFIQSKQILDNAERGYQELLVEIRARQQRVHTRLWELAKTERQEIVNARKAGTDITNEAQLRRVEFAKADAERQLTRGDVADIQSAMVAARQANNGAEFNRLGQLFKRKTRDMAIQSRVETDLRQEARQEGREYNEVRLLVQMNDRKQALVAELERAMGAGDDQTALRVVKELRPIEQQVLNLYRDVRKRDRMDRRRSREVLALEAGEIHDERQEEGDERKIEPW